MSGRSRGRKPSRAKGRGRAKARTRADPGAPASPASPERGASLGPAGPGRPDPDPGPDPAAAAAPLPLDCGLALRAVAAATASSLAERLAADSVFVGTAGLAGRPRPGPRGGGRRGAAAAGGKKAAASGGGAGKGGKGGKVKRGAAPGAHASARTHAEPPPAAPAPAPPPDGCMHTLESVQLRLETTNAQADRAYLRLARKFGQLRLHHLERRDLLIRSIPGFWARALQNHPQLAPLLSARDRRLLSHLRRLEVEELGLARLGYRIKLHFDRNPYFQNQLLVKEYGCGPSGLVVSRSTPIKWLPRHPDGEGQGEGQGGGDDDDNDEGGPSFFGWFSSHSAIQSDKIVEIINEELWPNPLQFYLMSDEEAPAENQHGQQEPARAPEPAEAPGLATPNPAN